MIGQKTCFFVYPHHHKPLFHNWEWVKNEKSIYPYPSFDKEGKQKFKIYDKISNMLEKQVKLISLPIMDDIASAVKSGGEYRQNLGTSELSELVGQAIQLLTDEYSFLTPKVTPPVVQIKPDGVINIETAVNTSTPVASVDLKVNWRNKEPGVLECVGLTLTSKYSNLARAGLFLKKIDPDKMIEAKVREPNKALGDVIRAQMKLRGVNVTRAGYTVDGSNVGVVVQGTKNII